MLIERQYDEFLVNKPKRSHALKTAGVYDSRRKRILQKNDAQKASRSIHSARNGFECSVQSGNSLHPHSNHRRNHSHCVQKKRNYVRKLNKAMKWAVKGVYHG